MGRQLLGVPYGTSKKRPRIVSDTGSGSNLDEFQSLRCSTNPIFTSKWGRQPNLDALNNQLALCTISENEINHFSINLRETDSSRSGTEASFMAIDSLDDLQLQITLFLRKICILKIPKVAVELLIDNHSVPGSQGNCVLAVDCSPLPSSATNAERLKSGLEEYALKHGNRLQDICRLCFSTKEHLKVGTGSANRSGTLQSNVQMMEAVVVISEVSERAIPSCYRACSSMTEVLFFKDFTPCLITQSSLDALVSIKWKDYGLSLKSIADQEGCVFLEWDSLPPSVHIDVVLHSYSKQYPFYSAIITDD
ncbi:hypothetical protein M9H77_10159 [Catharanthus roseus]|uniref:Uncharacterized protein n=1 Tax=Catharanthus roseus TaxID=4058 RepID=A0ACC0C2V5_CATRO|nr:hypothetical protein M9H77_10159 [Catharanthus roseus]